MSPKSSESTNPKFDPKDSKIPSESSESRKTFKKGKKGHKDPKSGRDRRGAAGEGSRGKGFSSNSINDTFWYTLNDDVLRDAASLPFSYPLGGVINSGATTDETLGVLRRGQASVPGVLRLNWRSSVGFSDTALSPINIAAGKFYAFVRQANSGSRNYEKSDLMMYFMALTDVYTRIEMAKRAYGLLKTYSNYNKYLGQALVAAAGFNWNDLSNNQANFRMRLNELIDQVNGCFHVPNNFKYIERHLFLNRVVVADRPNRKFQTYVPFMDTFLEFNGTGSAQGSCLVAVNNNGPVDPGFAPYVWNASGFITSLQAQVSKLVANEDISIMSGDILKAYGTAGCYKMENLDMEYQTPIVYDLPFLAQIHNTVSNAYCKSDKLRDAKFYWDGSFLPSNTVIYQQDNVIYSYPYYPGNTDGSNHVGYTDNVILNIPVDDPTPGDVMESTRNMYMVDGTNTFLPAGMQTEVNGMPIYCGSELFTQFVVYYFNANGALKSELFRPTGLATNTNDISITDQVYLRAVMLYSAFDWAPQLTVATGVDLPAVANKMKRVSVVGDMTNYSIIDVRFLQNIHHAALVALFDIPVFEVNRK